MRGFDTPREQIEAGHEANEARLSLEAEIAQYASGLVDTWQHLGVVDCLEQVEEHIASNYPEASAQVVYDVMCGVRDRLSGL